MSEAFVTNTLGLQHFRFTLDTYTSTIRRLRRELAYVEGVFPREMYAALTDAQYQAFIDHEAEFRREKLVHLRDKAKAVVAEFLRRRNLNVALTAEEVNGRLYIRGACPVCHVVINLMDAVVWDEPSHRLGLRCTGCGVERWLSG